MAIVRDHGTGGGDLERRSSGVQPPKTPNLDSLHKQSVCMTDCMVSPDLRPDTRRPRDRNPRFRTGVTHTIHGMEEMNRECIPLAQVLAGAHPLRPRRKVAPGKRGVISLQSKSLGTR